MSLIKKTVFVISLNVFSANAFSADSMPFCFNITPQLLPNILEAQVTLCNDAGCYSENFYGGRQNYCGSLPKNSSGTIYQATANISSPLNAQLICEPDIVVVPGKYNQNTSSIEVNINFQAHGSVQCSQKAIQN